ncbi:MAG TPA: hypothetical protein DCR70_09825 [Phycisphaerales bacterium]|nr:hypothetical protein [Phycisphaerales bacterium]
MAAAKNMDIKLLFEQYDMTPGAAGRKFFRNLMLHGGRTDNHGFSLADCFLRVDTHAVQAGQSIDLPPPAGTLAAPGAVANELFVDPPSPWQPVATNTPVQARLASTRMKRAGLMTSA